MKKLASLESVFEVLLGVENTSIYKLNLALKTFKAKRRYFLLDEKAKKDFEIFLKNLLKEKMKVSNTLEKIVKYLSQNELSEKDYKSIDPRYQYSRSKDTYVRKRRR